MRAAGGLAAALAGGFAICLAAGGCAPERRDWNVVVLLVDTLRADHLGAYGYQRPTSPNLDAFAAANVVFADHRSQSPCTFPSANSILTSRAPQHFDGRAAGDHGIPDGMPTLAEVLEARGYATLAVSASPIVRATPSRLNEVGGFGRGFHLFLERCEWRRAACVHNDAFTYLPLLRRPFFLYLHYMDAHAPYQPPDWYRRRFATDLDDAPAWVRKGDPKPIADMVYREAPGEIDQAHLRSLIDLYDDSIGFFDEQFALLLDKLEENDAIENTLIAVIADHGESFLEHAHVLHCRTLYEPEIRTPWLMRVPGLDGPVRIDGPSANLDVVPTILDLLGEDLAPHGFEGRSLRRAVERGQPVAGPVFAAWGRLGSATDGRHKLIADRKARTVALYDLAADPGEERDLADLDPETLRRLAGELTAWRHAVEQGRPEVDAPTGETIEERLQALGYLR